MTRRSGEALRLADDLIALARELDDPDLLVEAYHARMPGNMWTADFARHDQSGARGHRPL